MQVLFLDTINSGGYLNASTGIVTVQDLEEFKLLYVLTPRKWDKGRQSNFLGSRIIYSTIMYNRAQL